MSTRNTFSERYLWRSVLDLYYQEKLQGAYELAEEIGVGDLGSALRWFRLLEAEYQTSLSSIILEPQPWLSLEIGKDFGAETQDRLTELCLKEVESVCLRLGVQERPVTRISILARETDAPWATSPYGYCIEKIPFTKICLPHHLLADSEHLAEAARHEYAHVLTANLGKGRVPRWLNEAISTMMETGRKQGGSEKLTKPQQWFSPVELGAIFQTEPMPVGKQWVDQVMGTDWSASDRLPRAQSNPVTMAYHQCSIIGKYLREKGGEQKVGALLKAIGDDSVANSLRRILFGSDPVDLALKKVFGLSQVRLFDKVRAWF